MITNPNRRPPATAVSVAFRGPERLQPADPASPFHALGGAIAPATVTRCLPSPRFRTGRAPPIPIAGVPFRSTRPFHASRDRAPSSFMLGGATREKALFFMSRLTGGRDAATTRGARSCWLCSRDEHLNVELFFSVADAQRKLLEWQRDYNEDRPCLPVPSGVRGPVAVNRGRRRRNPQPRTGRVVRGRSGQVPRRLPQPRNGPDLGAGPRPTSSTSNRSSCSGQVRRPGLGYKLHLTGGLR